MAQLAQLRQKIRSIQTTKKITHAVRLVSMSLYNKMDKQTTPLKYYTNNIKSLFTQLVVATPQWKSPLLFPEDTLNTTPLYIIIATTKGLCGSLNSNLFRYIDNSITIQQDQNANIIAIGQRAIKFAKEKNLGKLVCTYGELSSGNFIAIADDLHEKILNGNPTYSSVTFLHNTATSFFLQKPILSTLIPLIPGTAPATAAIPSSDQQNITGQVETALLWEQSNEKILDHCASCYLRSSIIHILFQSLRAEHAARFLAMENSTNNAEKYLERLTLQLNKLRQALITKEVAELSSVFPTR